MAMDKDFAAKIFGIPADSSPEEIEKRYGIIVKKFKQQQLYIPEGMEQSFDIKEVNDAYYALMNIDMTDSADKIEDPNEREEYILKRKVKDFFRYNITKILIFSFFVAIFLYGVISFAMREHNDIGVVFYGDFSSGVDSELLEQYYEREIEEIDNIDLRIITVAESIPYRIKEENRSQMVSMIATDTLDVIFLDYDTYRECVALEYLMPTTDYLDAETASKEAAKNDILKVYKAETGEQYFGIDVTGTPYLDRYGMYDGTDYIMCVISNTKNIDKVKAFVNYTIEQRDKTGD